MFELTHIVNRRKTGKTHEQNGSRKQSQVLTAKTAVSTDHCWIRRSLSRNIISGDTVVASITCMLYNIHTQIPLSGIQGLLCGIHSVSLFHFEEKYINLIASLGKYFYFDKI